MFDHGDKLTFLLCHKVAFITTILKFRPFLFKKASTLNGESIQFSRIGLLKLKSLQYYIKLCIGQKTEAFKRKYFAIIRYDK